MTQTTDNIIDRDELQQNLIDQILDDMDLKTLMQLVAEQLDNNYDQYTVDELIEEAKEYYPHLLDWLPCTNKQNQDYHFHKTICNLFKTNQLKRWTVGNYVDWLIKELKLTNWRIPSTNKLGSKL